MGYLLRLTVVTACTLVVLITGKSEKDQPNIIILLSDDIGWTDYEVNDPEMATPALTALAQRGLTLNQSYTLQACSPTRSALLSGRYAHRIGMQVGKIIGTTLRWLDSSIKLLPAALKKLNYTTHIVGKWHLGFCDWKLTPLKRGFDTFYGFYSGEQDYFNHSGAGGGPFDFRDNVTVAWDTRGKYSTELHTKRVEKIIKDRGDKPFFIYMAYQNAHSPWQSAPRYENKYCSHVKNDARRTQCAMVAAMDESIANITKTLRKEKIDDNTIILYLSDNGGPTGSASRNWPMRGGKGTFWEGGMRSYTIFVHPKKLRKVNATWDSLVHVTDWYTTLLSAAGGDVDKEVEEQQLDGYDHLKNLRKLQPGKRDRMVYNIDDRRQRASVRIGDLKLIKGQPSSLSAAGWVPTPYLMEKGEKEITVDKLDKWHLFNVRQDPEEKYNLIEKYRGTDTLEKLISFMKREEKKVIPFPKLVKEPLGDADLYGGAWSPGWCCA